MKPGCRFVVKLVTLDKALAISRLALVWSSNPVSSHAQTILISICLYDLNDWFHLELFICRHCVLCLFCMVTLFNNISTHICNSDLALQLLC